MIGINNLRNVFLLTPRMMCAAACGLIVCLSITIAAAEQSPRLLMSLAHPALATTLPAATHFNPEAGTAEFWLTLDFDPRTVKSNQNLLEVRFGKNDSLGLYFNALEKQLVFYLRDADDPRSDFHSKQYPVFMVSGSLDWQRGERHHIAVTWSPQISRLYLDGKGHRRSHFYGSIKLSGEQDGEIVVGRGAYKIDAARLWSLPRAPRRIDSIPTDESLADEKLVASTSPWPDATANHHAGRITIGTSVGERANAPAPVPASVYGHPPVTLAVDGGFGWSGERDKASAGENWLRHPVQVKTEPGLRSTWLPITSRDDALVVALEIHNATEQTIVSDVAFEWPLIQPGMHGFFAADDCPFPVEQGRPYYSYTRSTTYGADAQMPIVTVYDPLQNTGLTLTTGDRTFENVTFDLGMEAGPEVMRVVHHALSLAPGETRVIRHYLVGHDGDWRPGLGAYAALFPAIMNPPQGPIADGLQSMIIGGPSSDEFLEDIVALDVGWREVSLMLGEGAGFGNYIPDDLSPYMESVESYRRDIANMLRHDVEPLMYIQARECKDVARAVTEFADSVVRRSDGEPETNVFGPFGATMTCRPGTAWFDHLVDQANRELSVFPNCSGVFFDNAWHTEYSEILCAIAKVMHAQGKSLASNGANAMSVGCTDSIMAESHFQALGSLQYLGLVTPVTYVPIYATGLVDGRERELTAPGLPANLINDLRHCLVSGAFYAFNYRAVRYWSDESKALYQSYRPLQQLLHGRQWLLHAHALTLPDELRGNIFQVPDNRWVVTLADPDADAEAHVRVVDEPVVVRLNRSVGSARVSACRLYDLSSDQAKPVTFRQSGDKLMIDLDEINRLAVIEICFADEGEEGQRR